MKLINNPFLLVLCIIAPSFVFFGCKKGSSSPATTSINGYWSGSYTPSGTSYVNSCGFLFESNGTTIFYDFYGATSLDTATCPTKGTGTYTLSNNTLTCVWIGNPNVNYSAKLNTSVSPNTITGTYSSTQSGGTFTIKN